MDKESQEKKERMEEESKEEESEKSEDSGDVSEESSHKAHKTEGSSHKAHHGDHAKRVRVRRHKRRPSSVWMWTSFVLAVLFIISLFTCGFTGNCHGGDLQGMVTGLDDEIDQAETDEIRTALASAKTNLVEAMDLKASQENISSADSASGESVAMDFYVMSQCPYGTQVVDAIAPVKDKLGDSLDLTIDYIFYPQSQYQGKEVQYCVEDLCSMHGTPEVEGDIVQLCAMEHNPDKYLDMLTCMNQNMNQIPGNWEQCAEDNGLDIEKVRECYEGDEGLELARESMQRATEAGARGSPTIYLAGEQYQGARSEADFLRAICGKFDDKPQACEDVPEPVEFQMLIVNDKDCPNCDTSNIEAVTKQLFPAVEVVEYDAEDPQGKELIDELSLEKAPAYLFGSDVTETATWQSRPQLAASFEEKGDYYKLMDSQTGANFYFDDEKQAEAQKAPMEALNITEGGKPQLDFFVMSFCPYGIQAENGIIPVQESLGDKAEFVPHFVIYSSGSGCREAEDGSQYCSMHGAGELNEDIRQLCIYEDQQDKFFPYIKAVSEKYGAGEVSSSNIDDKWKDIAEEVGVDVAAVEECYDDEDRVLSMLAREQELNSLLNVRGSPTVFLNGAKYSGGRSPDNFLQAVCSEFDEPPAGCETQLSTEGATASGEC